MPFKDCRDDSTVQIQYTESSDFSTHNTSRMSGGRTPQQLRAERKQAQSHLDIEHPGISVIRADFIDRQDVPARAFHRRPEVALPATKLRRHLYLWEGARP